MSKERIPNNEPTVFQVISEPLKNLVNTKMADVQDVVASQMHLLTIYHQLVLEQARQSFRWALKTGMYGFCFLILSILLLLLKQSFEVSLISLISGSLIEFISGIHFYLYNKATLQMAGFHEQLYRTQRFLLANSLIESLDGNLKHQTRSELVQVIAEIKADLKSHNVEVNPVKGQQPITK